MAQERSIRGRSIDRSRFRKRILHTFQYYLSKRETTENEKRSGWVKIERGFRRTGAKYVDMAGSGRSGMDVGMRIEGDGREE